ncbi:MAG: prepilin peptidase [Clostridiaceae bacterium]|nr:prepilin peptidase [Clostridiaceae bacterium]
MDMTFYYIYFALVGLIIGSFLNVCIYRIPREESIVRPPSHCPNCGNRLTFIDLVPVFSFLFLRGKCRHCSAKISPRYAMVELLTSLIFVLLLYKYKLTVDFFAAAYLMSILIAIFFIDLEHMIIPDGLVLAGLVGGIPLVVYNLFRPIEIYGDRNWWTPLVGMLSGFVVLLFIGLVGLLIYKTDEAMGGGDIKLFAPLGLFLGWKLIIVAFLLSVFSAAIVSVILIITKVKSRKSTVPFGPFIVIGTFITYLYGWEILEWYLRSSIGS